jgi:hypothetical protein
MGVGKSGRKAPGRFDETTRGIILEKLAAGSTRRAACGAAFLMRRTLAYWCERGRKELEEAEKAAADAGLPLTVDDLTEHAVFMLQVEDAEATDQDFLVGKIREVGEARDLRWLLERRHSEGWGSKPVEVQHSGSIDVKVVADARLSLSKKLGAHLGRAGFVPPDQDGGEGAGA